MTEAANRDGTQLGLDALAEVIRLNQALPAEQIIQKVLQRLNAFIEGSPLIDDVTLVVCKVA